MELESFNPCFDGSEARAAHASRALYSRTAFQSLF